MSPKRRNQSLKLKKEANPPKPQFPDDICFSSSNDRKANLRHFVLCEGKNTEPLYFNAWGKANNTPLEAIFANFTDPENILQAATKYVRAGYSVSIVYDTEGMNDFFKSHQQIINFISEANQKGINMVSYSTPCIEYWFLLHFLYTTKPYTCYDEIRRELRTYLTGYDKNFDFCKTLYSQIENLTLKASRNASTSRKDRENAHNGTSVMRPFTNIDILLDYYVNFEYE